MFVNFTAIKINKSENNRVLNPSPQSSLKYTKNLTQDTVSFKGYPGDSRESDLFEGLKFRNSLRLDQLEKEGFNYQSPFIPEAIKVLEAWRADTEKSDPDLSWRLGELRNRLEYISSESFLKDCRDQVAY